MNRLNQPHARFIKELPSASQDDCPKGIQPDDMLISSDMREGSSDAH
jgi:hypothetical protein